MYDDRASVDPGLIIPTTSQQQFHLFLHIPGKLSHQQVQLLFTGQSINKPTIIGTHRCHHADHHAALVDGICQLIGFHILHGFQTHAETFGLGFHDHGHI